MTFLAEAAAASPPVTAASTEVADAADPPPTTVLNGSRILLVDDNAVNRQVVKLFLRLLDVKVTEAANGKEALEALAKAEFDIVLLDVHMPVMDGTETIKAIRGSHESWSGIPTIALTADAMSSDRERYLAMGMTDYLAKPVDQRELLSKMARVLAPRLVSMSAPSEDVAPALGDRNKRASG
jgi:CheY-like chemotaxis protein